jgi:hypothetical protein
MLMKKLVAGAATSVLALAAMSAVAYAQEITGGINGEITDDAGHPLPGVKVKVTYSPTGATLTATTSKDGYFTVRNLQVGGPYSVTASDATHTAKTVQVDQITIGSPYELDFSLEGGIQEVTVKGKRTVGTSQVQTGPRSTFTATDIQTLPTFSRDLKDIARLNPFVTIDPTNSNALLIAGSNPRFNTIYVDGVKQSDDFGLNGNGYPTQRSPISIDAIKAFNVEIAPYDVQYGEFQGGVLNIVTKGGSNQLHGGLFDEYDSYKMAGAELGAAAVNQPKCLNQAQTGTFSAFTNFNQAPGSKSTVTCGERLLNPNFKDKNYGGYLSGAIIPDRLFFFFDYEKYQGIAPTAFTASDQGGAAPVPGVTTAQVNDVINILKNTYGYNAGSVGGGAPTTDEKYFVRLDANITDNQHLFVTYQSTKGNTLNFPNGSTSATAGILALSSNYYVNEQNLEAYTADLTSHWTNQFSTELEYTHKTVDTISAINGVPTAGEFKITLQKAGTDQPSIYVGPDVSRQANNLSTVDNQYKGKANYIWGDHTFTVGYEHEDTQSSDLFVQNANGTYTFSNNCGSTGYDAYGVPLNLSNQQACQLVYANAYNNIAATAATNETTTIQTGYLQDEWRVLPNLSVKGGLRFEYYSVNSAPPLNQRFLAQYGFPNNVTLNGDDIVMPRIGFNWRPDPTWTISGGFGLFSGGDPTVYFYDSYDNPGNLLGSVTLNCSGANTANCSSSLSAVNINKVGTAAQTANTNSANLGTGITNAVDPNFNVPSDWKASISVRKTLNFSNFGWMGRFGPIVGDDWTVHFDDVFQKVNNGVQWVDIFGAQHVLATTAPDGRPEFDPTRFTLTSPSGSTLPPDDIELKNTHKGGGNVVAVGFGKSWASGWDFDLTYTHEDIKEISPATSSVAVSNYRQDAFSDPNNPPLAPSVYNVDHEVKLNVNYQHKFFGDNNTTFRLYGDWRTGLPYSYTFEGAFPTGTGTITTSSTGNFDEAFGQFALLGSTWGELLYVPKTDSTGNVTATSDPKVTYSANFNVAAFDQFLKSTGLIKYAGSISPRNAFTSSDVTRFDFEFTQEFPAFIPNGAKGQFYFDLFNIGNLLDKNWGVIKQTSFPYLQSPVQAINCQAAFQAAAKLTAANPVANNGACLAGTGNFYEYRPGSATTETLGSTSGGIYYPAWQVKLGIRYKF